MMLDMRTVNSELVNPLQSSHNKIHIGVAIGVRKKDYKLESYCL